MVSNPLISRRFDAELLLKSVFGAVAVIAGAFLVASIFVAVLGVLFALLNVQGLENLRAHPLLYSVVQAVAATGFIVAAVGYLSLRNEWEILHVRRPTPRTVALVVGGFIVLVLANVGISIIVSVVLTALESLFGISVDFGQNAVTIAGKQSPPILLYMIPVSLFIVGPGEELVFRGVVQGLFRRIVGVVPAILIASLLFGLGHYLAIRNGSPWPYIFTAGVMGIVLGSIYEYTEDITIPAAVHGLWNSAIFLLTWVSVT